MVEEIIEEVTTTPAATPVVETPEEVPAPADDAAAEPVVDETITTA